MAEVSGAAGSQKFSGARFSMVCMPLQNLEEFCRWEDISCHCLKLAEKVTPTLSHCKSLHIAKKFIKF